MNLDYEDSNTDLDILLKFDFKEVGLLWWRELTYTCRIIPIIKYGTKKIGDKEIRDIEECVYSHVKSSMMSSMKGADKEGNYMISLSSEWEKPKIKKILNQFINKLTA